MSNPLSDNEIHRAQVLCEEMGECSATYYIVLLIQEVERLRNELPYTRVRSRLMGLEDGLSANSSDDLYAALKQAKEFIEDLQLPDAEWNRVLDLIVAALARADGKAV